MHPSYTFAIEQFAAVIYDNADLDTAIALCNQHSVGARSRFYRLVDAYTN